MKTLSDYARSIRYATMLTMIAATSVVQACSGDAIPTAPSSAASSAATGAGAPARTQLRVFGTVTDDEGKAVAGVNVTIYSWPNGGTSSAVTDNMGFYSSSFMPASGISAFTEKVGYESEWHVRNNAPTLDGQFDLRIHRAK